MTIHSLECMGCLPCVAVCPAENALALSLPQAHPLGAGNSRMSARAVALGIALLFFGVVGYAKTAGFWKSQVPNGIYERLVPHAEEAQHPMGY